MNIVRIKKTFRVEPDKNNINRVFYPSIPENIKPMHSHLCYYQSSQSSVKNIGNFKIFFK